jgi:hypothetical protein
MGLHITWFAVKVLFNQIKINNLESMAATTEKEN